MQYESASSCDLKVTSGTIQGSVLGPLLWSLFINQLTIKLKVPSVLFADDFKMLFNLQIISHFIAQAEINLFSDWCNENYVVINAVKSCCIHSVNSPRDQYRCGNTLIPNLPFFKDLGVIRSSKGYDLHSEYTVNKAQKLCMVIMKNITIPDNLIGWRLFTTYVQPVLLYGSVAWHPLQQETIKTIDTVQRRYTKKLYGNSSLSYEQRLKSLNALPSKCSLAFNDMIFAFKVINHLIPFEPSDFGFQMSANSRGPMFVLELVRRSRVRHFARYRIPCQRNTLPFEIRSTANINKFKDLLTNWLSLNRSNCF